MGKAFAWAGLLLTVLIVASSSFRIFVMHEPPNGFAFAALALGALLHAARIVDERR